MGIHKEFMREKVDCPRCWKEMMRHKVKVFGPGIDIDICPKCQGVWLDTDELGKLLKDRKLTNYLTKHIGTKTESKLVCPRCGGLMDLETADDVEVDVCLTCHGVWLDEGELDSLKQKSAEGYKGDPGEKALEMWEESVAKNRKSRYSRFMRRFR